MGLEGRPYGRQLLAFANRRPHLCECRIPRNEADEENGNRPEALVNQAEAYEDYERGANRQERELKPRGHPVAGIPRHASHGDGGQEAGDERDSKRENILLTNDRA